MSSPARSFVVETLARSSGRAVNSPSPLIAQCVNCLRVMELRWQSGREAAANRSQQRGDNETSCVDGSDFRPDRLCFEYTCFELSIDPDRR